MSLASVREAVREVTDSEVAFYREHGWVKLDQLVSPEVAGIMLDLAARQLTETAGAPRGTSRTLWNERRFAARDDREEPFYSTVFSPTIGRNAQRLIGREVPVRYWTDVLACKIPVGREAASAPTGWHQDLPNYSHDRLGTLSFWIALDHVTPEQGAMRFVDGSQVEGPLGRTRAGGPDHLEQYPELLDRHDISPPLTLRPGDATCHGGLTVHGAPANSADKSRWSYILTYFPDDVLYNGAAYSGTDNLGLKVAQPFDDPHFPVVCT